MLTATGGAAASPDGTAAVDALSRLTLAVRSRLGAAADGEPLLPRFHLSEPMLQAAMGGMGGMNGMPMMDGGSMAGGMTMPENGKGEGRLIGEAELEKKKTRALKHSLSPFPFRFPGMLTKLMTSKTFFKFAPCVLHEMKTGASASLTGLRFAPALVSVMTDLLEARFDGININPMLLYVQSMGANVQPQGLDVQPALVREMMRRRKKKKTFFLVPRPPPTIPHLFPQLYIGPMGVSVQPQGLNVEPKGLAVMPMGTNVAPQGDVVAPVRDMRMPVSWGVVQGLRVAHRTPC